MIAYASKLPDLCGFLSIDPTTLDDVAGLPHDSGGENREALPATCLEVREAPLEVRSQAVFGDAVRKLDPYRADRLEEAGRVLQQALRIGRMASPPSVSRSQQIVDNGLRNFTQGSADPEREARERLHGLTQRAELVRPGRLQQLQFRAIHPMAGPLGRALRGRQPRDQRRELIRAGKLRSTGIELQLGAGVGREAGMGFREEGVLQRV